MIDMEKLLVSVRLRDEAIASLAKAASRLTCFYYTALGVIIGLLLHPLVTDAVVYSGTNLVDYIFVVQPTIR